jgi:hypothetical protein
MLILVERDFLMKNPPKLEYNPQISNPVAPQSVPAATAHRDIF